jgi:hypothetical protein
MLLDLDDDLVASACVKFLLSSRRLCRPVEIRVDTGLRRDRRTFRSAVAALTKVVILRAPLFEIFILRGGRTRSFPLDIVILSGAETRSVGAQSKDLRFVGRGRTVQSCR